MPVIQIQERRNALMDKLVELAIARGRDILIGSANPSDHYIRLREKFPHAIMVLDEHSVTVKGKIR